MTGNLGKFHVVLGTNRLEDSEMTGNWKISRRFRCKSVGGLGDDGEFRKIPRRFRCKSIRGSGDDGEFSKIPRRVRCKSIRGSGDDGEFRKNPRRFRCKSVGGLGDDGELENSTSFLGTNLCLTRRAFSSIRIKCHIDIFIQDPYLRADWCKRASI